MNGGAVTEAATRVALLARQGAASERLQAALHDAGADIVLVSDPADTDVDGVRTTGAQAILVALEPAVEDALERFAPVLTDPAVPITIAGVQPFARSSAICRASAPTFIASESSTWTSRTASVPTPITSAPLCSHVCTSADA